jgi:hypothetical protein
VHDFQNSSYYYRRTQDGSWEAVCLTCFTTAARTMELSELAGIATMHDCNPLSFTPVQKLPTMESERTK